MKNAEEMRMVMMKEYVDKVIEPQIISAAENLETSVLITDDFARGNFDVVAYLESNGYEVGVEIMTGCLLIIW